MVLVVMVVWERGCKGIGGIGQAAVKSRGLWFNMGYFDGGNKKLHLLLTAK